MVRIFSEADYNNLPQLELGTIRAVCEADDPRCDLGRFAGGTITGLGDLVFWESEGLVYRLAGAGGTPQQVGANGSGPGEYRYVLSLQVGSKDEIQLYDAAQQRLLEFTPDGEPLRTSRMALPEGFVDGRLTPVGFISLATSLSGPDRSGDSARVALFHLQPEGARPLKLAVLPISQRAYRLADMRPLPKLFEAMPQWQISIDARIAYSSGDRWEVDQFDSTGAHINRVGFVHTARPVEAAEAEREQERRRRGIGRVQALHSATQHPAITMLRLLDNGQLWVRESPDVAGDVVSWIVFDPDGTPIGRLVLPVETEILAGRDSTVLINAPTEGGLLLVRVVASPGAGSR
ncbi:MAG: 6-bladed beta-propeller [Gemmatimonadota bacterium]|nr:6-bladed beta-propeller [Gemmatimonadota bacterium]